LPKPILGKSAVGQLNHDIPEEPTAFQTEAVQKVRILSMEDRLTQILSSFRGNKVELIPLLQRVQEEYGYLPEEALLRVAAHTNTPESEVYSVATFYAQFRLKPIGRKRVMICRGTACHVRGAPLILEAAQRRLGISVGETTEDLEFTLDTVACIGACGLAPCMMVNKEVHGRLTSKSVLEVLGTHGSEQGNT